MPLRLTSSMSRKIGLPEYGSLGASCGLELELAADTIVTDPDAVSARAQQVQALCARLVDDALARHRPLEGSSSTAEGRHLVSTQRVTTAGYPPRATTRQLDYARQLAGQIRGPEGLEALAQRMFGRLPTELTRTEASQLIDRLKEVLAGSPADQTPTESDPCDDRLAELYDSCYEDACRDGFFGDGMHGDRANGHAAD